MILEMRTRITAMEGQLCHCGKGKGKVVGEEGPSVLSSPLVLDCSEEGDNTSNGSYHTPPLADSSIPSHPSPSIAESDKENAPAFSIGYDPRKITLVPIEGAPPENAIPLPICEPSLNISGLEQLIAVRGQRAVRSAGRPKSQFHPY